MQLWEFSTVHFTFFLKYFLEFVQLYSHHSLRVGTNLFFVSSNSSIFSVNCTWNFLFIFRICFAYCFYKLWAVGLATMDTQSDWMCFSLKTIWKHSWLKKSKVSEVKSQLCMQYFTLPCILFEWQGMAAFPTFAVRTAASSDCLSYTLWACFSPLRAPQIWYDGQFERKG